MLRRLLGKKLRKPGKQVSLFYVVHQPNKQRSDNEQNHIQDLQECLIWDKNYERHSQFLAQV